MRKRDILATLLFVAAAGVLLVALVRGWLWLYIVGGALALAAMVAEAEND